MVRQRPTRVIRRCLADEDEDEDEDEAEPLLHFGRGSGRGRRDLHTFSTLVAEATPTRPTLPAAPEAAGSAAAVIVEIAELASAGYRPEESPAPRRLLDRRPLHDRRKVRHLRCGALDGEGRNGIRLFVTSGALQQ